MQGKITTHRVTTVTRWVVFVCRYRPGLVKSVRRSRANGNEVYESLREIMRRDLGKYRLEIIVAILALFGVLLVTVGASLQDILVNQAQDLVSGSANVVQSVGQQMNQFLATRSVFDLLGIVLITGAVIFFAWRIRERVIHSARWTARACPLCGGELTRVPRHFWDRVAGVFLPVRRYACNNPTCGWQGLRITRGKRRKDHVHKSRA